MVLLGSGVIMRAGGRIDSNELRGELGVERGVAPTKKMSKNQFE